MPSVIKIVQKAPVPSGPKKRFKPPPSVITAKENSTAVKKRKKAPPAGWNYDNAKDRMLKKRKAVSRDKREGTDTFTIGGTDGAVGGAIDDTDYHVPADYKHLIGAAPFSANVSDIIARYQPRKLEDLIGQPTGQVRGWLERHKAHKKNLPRALLIVGPSGVGKSSAARLAISELGYQNYEYSLDDRAPIGNKKECQVLSVAGIEEVIYKLAVRNSAFEKFAILLDGVGTMDSETQKALVEVISGAKYARQFNRKAEGAWLAPIIITCGSEDLPNLCSLTRVCQVLEFVPPSMQELTAFFNDVCAKEALTVAPETRSKVIEGCGGDCRRLLNTLNFLAVHGSSSGAVGNDALANIDVTSVFYNQANQQDLFRLLVKKSRFEKVPLTALDDLLDAHPISLALIIQENAPLFYSGESLGGMADMCEYLSFTDELGKQTPNINFGEQNEAITILSTWGATQMLLFSNGPNGFSESPIINGPLNRSEVFGWAKKTKYRKRMIAGLTRHLRGPEFIDLATCLSTMVSVYHTKKGVGRVCDTIVELFKDRRMTYKDCQDMWKCSRIPSLSTGTETMPNPRGNASLIKRLKI